MISYDEAGYVTYEVVYKVRYGKLTIRAYLGDDREAYEEALRELGKRDDIRYLSKSVTMTDVTLFD